MTTKSKIDATRQKQLDKLEAELRENRVDAIEWCMEHHEEHRRELLKNSKEELADMVLRLVLRLELAHAGVSNAVAESTAEHRAYTATKDKLKEKVGALNKQYEAPKATSEGATDKS